MIPNRGEAFRWRDYRPRIVSLLEIMKRFPAEEFLRLGALMSALEMLVERYTSPVDFGPEKDRFLSRLKEAEQLCRDSGLEMTRLAVLHLRALVGSSEPVASVALGKS